MPFTADTLKAKIDADITNKTAPYSISNVDVGVDMKAMIDLMVSLVTPAAPEIVPFTNQTQVVIAWNATRIAKFGAAGDFVVEILGDDTKYRQSQVEIVPDNITATTQYTITLGQQCSGRIVIK